MKKQLLTGALIVGAATIGVLGQVSPARALGITCPTNLFDATNNTSLVSNTTGCQYYSPLPANPSQVSVAEIQAQNFFGFTDWTSGGQNGTVISGSGLSGNWNISNLNLWQTYSDVMLVFKDGRDTSPVAYRLVQNAVSGTWQSPFRDPPFTNLNQNQIKEVSNITVYYRGQATAIPTPALIPAAIGASLALLRKKKQEEQAAQDA